jgi:hypothetical protein
VHLPAEQFSEACAAPGWMRGILFFDHAA